MQINKTTVILLLLLAVVLAGCNQGPDKLIEKTWKVTSVLAKGTVNDSTFQLQKASLMKADMTFSNNSYSMTSDGKTLESGTYTLANDRLQLKTEKGMTMDASVTKEQLTLDTPDFTITLQPK